MTPVRTIKTAYPDLRAGQYVWLNAGARVADWRGGWRWVQVKSVGHKWVVFAEPHLNSYRIAAGSVDHYIMAARPEPEEFDDERETTD